MVLNDLLYRFGKRWGEIDKSRPLWFMFWYSEESIKGFSFISSTTFKLHQPHWNSHEQSIKTIDWFRLIFFRFEFHRNMDFLSRRKNLDETRACIVSIILYRWEVTGNFVFSCDHGNWGKPEISTCFATLRSRLLFSVWLNNGTYSVLKRKGFYVAFKNLLTYITTRMLPSIRGDLNQLPTLGNLSQIGFGRQANLTCPESLMVTHAGTILARRYWTSEIGQELMHATRWRGWRRGKPGRSEIDLAGIICIG